MDLRIDTVPSGDVWEVRLKLSLDRAETNELFLAGDRLVSWPTDGMVVAQQSGPVGRSSMFISEIVARPSGLQLAYESEELANRAAKIVAYQIRTSVGQE